MRTDIVSAGIVCAAVILTGCTSSPTPTSSTAVPSDSASGDGAAAPSASIDPDSAASGVAGLPCIGTDWDPVLPDKWVFSPFPTDSAALVPCDEPHTGIRVASWGSDANTSTATRPGIGVQQELQAMAPDRVRCGQAVAELLGSDRPTRFQSVLSYSADRSVAVCDVYLMNNEPIVLADRMYIIDPGTPPFAPLPSFVQDILSGTLWQGYARCVADQTGGRIGRIRTYTPSLCPGYAVYAGNDPRFVTRAGYLNPQGDEPFPGSAKAARRVTAECGPGPHSVPDSLEWAAGGPYECWAKSRPKRTASERQAVLPPDPETLVPGTCLGYTAVYAISTVRAADRPVPCDGPHTAVVVDSWPSYDRQELPPAGWTDPTLLYDPARDTDGEPLGPRVTGKQDQDRCEDMAWSLAGRNHGVEDVLGTQTGWRENTRTTLAARVLYLPDADGRVMARCDLANLAGLLPTDVAGVNLSESWVSVAKCVRKYVRSDYPINYKGFISDEAKRVLCSDPAALAQTKNVTMPGPDVWPGRAAALRMAREFCGEDRVISAPGTTTAAPPGWLKSYQSEDWRAGRQPVCATPIPAASATPSGMTPSAPPPPVNLTSGQLTAGQIQDLLLTTEQAAAALGVTTNALTMDAPAPCRTIAAYTECTRSWWNSQAGVWKGGYADAPQAASLQILYPTSASVAQEPLAELRKEHQAAGFTIQSASPAILVAVRKEETFDPTPPYDGGNEMRIVTAIGQTIVVASCWATSPQAWAYCAHSLSRAQLARLSQANNAASEP